MSVQKLQGDLGSYIEEKRVVCLPYRGSMTTKSLE